MYHYSGFLKGKIGVWILKKKFLSEPAQMGQWSGVGTQQKTAKNSITFWKPRNQKISEF